MKLLRYWSKHAREVGAKNAFQIAWTLIEGRLFDLRHRTDTFKRISLGQLVIPSDRNKEHGLKYDASSISPFRKIISSLDLSADETFVDVGCGKGRTLLLASHFPFQKVVGVEFSGELCAIARRNVEIYSRAKPGLAPIEVIEADAAQMEIKPEYTCFYFFDPFDEVIWRKVCANILQSWRLYPRRIRMVYCHPRNERVLAEFDMFKLRSDTLILGRRFLVYEAADVPGRLTPSNSVL